MLFLWTASISEAECHSGTPFRIICLHQLVEALHYNLESAGLIPDGVTGIFH